MDAGDAGAGAEAEDPEDGMTDTANSTDSTGTTNPPYTPNPSNIKSPAHVIDVAIVDNDAITLQALRALLERTDGLRVPWTARSGRDALVACLTDERWPDVMLVDAELGDMSGMEVCRRLRAENGRTGILVVTAYPVECFAAGAARAGAQGIVGKADYPWLVSAIRAVAAGRPFANPRIRLGATDEPPSAPAVTLRWESAETACRRIRAEESETIARRGSSRNRDAADTLSRQESQVLELAAKGLTQKEIAARLGITAASVRTHSSRARRKLDARTLIQAVAAWVMRNRNRPE